MYFSSLQNLSSIFIKRLIITCSCYIVHHKNQHLYKLVFFPEVSFFPLRFFCYHQFFSSWDFIRGGECHRPLYLLRYLKAKNTYPTKEVFIFKYIQIFNCNIWEIFHPVQFSVTSTEELNFGYSTANSWINQMWLESISNVIKRLMPVHHDHFDAILDLLAIHCIRTIN